MPSRSYLGVLDFDANETRTVLQRAADFKQRWNSTQHPETLLLGSTLAGVYEKPSLRTRVTFEAGMTQLGGASVYLGPNDFGLGTRESAADVARGLSRWVQIIAARTFAHNTVEQLAAHASIPVINALSDREHPCQALADFLTLRERFGRIEGLTLAYVGDGNNVAHSLMLMGALLGTNVALATPAGYEPQRAVVQQAQQLAGQHDATITITHDPRDAVRDADAVYTDVWASMGQEGEASARTPVFTPYRVTAELLAASGKPNTIFMHCLPAHRGEEVAADVVDGPQSVVFDQAENRLHVQKALILHLLGK